MMGTVAQAEGILPEYRVTTAESVPGLSTGFSNNGHLDHRHGFESFGVLLPPDNRSLLNPLKDISWLREKPRGTGGLQRMVRVYRGSDQYEGEFNVPAPYTVAPTIADFVRRKLKRGDTDFVWGSLYPHTPCHSETAAGWFHIHLTTNFRH
jgi:hypothetical protein